MSAFKRRSLILVLALTAFGALAAETTREPISRREVLLRAARNQTVARQFAKSLEYYREYLDAWPDDTAIATEFGGVLLQAQQTDEAVRVLKGVLDKAPQTQDAYRLLADACLIQKDFAAAAEILEKAVARFAQEQPLRLKLADVYAWSGRYNDAIRQYRMLLLERPDDAALMKGLLQVMQWAEMVDAYLAESGRFLARHPEDVTIRLARVDLFAARKDFTAAADECRGILKVQPDHALARARLAQFLAWLGEWEQARTEYEAALALNPRDTGLRREYGQLLLWTNRYADALAIYRKLIAELPGDENLSREYLDVAGRTRPLAPAEKQWIDAFYRAHGGAAPQGLQPATLAALGRALKAAGLNAEALGILETALKTSADDLTLRLEYADLLSALGRTTDAEAQYELLLKKTGKRTEQ